MKCNVRIAEAIMDVAVLPPAPPSVCGRLGQLVGAAYEGLLALSVEVGLGVAAEAAA